VKTTLEEGIRNPKITNEEERPYQWSQQLLASEPMLRTNSGAFEQFNLGNNQFYQMSMFRVKADAPKVTFPDNLFLSGNWFRPKFMGNSRRLKNVEVILEWAPEGANNNSLVVLTLAEAETIRRIIHRRQAIIEGVSLGLHTLYGFCDDANPWILQDSPAYHPDPTNRTKANMQVLRFFASEMYYDDEKVEMVCRALFQNDYHQRRLFFDGMINHRRRMRRDTAGATPPHRPAHAHSAAVIAESTQVL